MTKVAKELRFNGTIPTTPTSAYDPDKVNLGTLMYQRTGAGGADNFVGPLPLPVARPQEDGTEQLAVGNVHAVTWSSEIDWIFLLGGLSESTFQRLVFYHFNKTTGTFAYQGYASLTMNQSGTYTGRCIRAIYSPYTTGTASVSGTAVTGVGSSWSTDRMCVGSRIGFGSTDPTQISTWYEISSVDSNTGITLTSSAGTIADGPYVIEDLMIACSFTNSTAANSGLYLVKGLRPDVFIPSGTTIAAGATVDLQRRVYKLDSPFTPDNTGPFAVDTMTSWINQTVVLYQGLTAYRLYVYNLRAPLTGLSGGVSTSAALFRTGQYPITVAGTNLTQHARIATPTRGTAKGEKSFFHIAGGSFQRIRLDSLHEYNFFGDTDGAGVFINAYVSPPGGTLTFTTATNTVFRGLDYIPSRGLFIIYPTNRNTGVRGYVSRFNANIAPMDKIWSSFSDQMANSTQDSKFFPHLNNSPSSTGATGMTGFTPSSNITYVLRGRSGITALDVGSNQLFAVPFAAHWDYPDAEIITPRIAIADSTILYNVFISDVRKLGDLDGAITPEPYRVYYRTRGIRDNTGKWYELPADGDLSGVEGEHIQFRFEFRTIGNYCVPARIHGINLTYDRKDDLPTQYIWNFRDSSAIDGTFGFQQMVAFGASPPTHTIEIRRSDNEKLLVRQASNEANKYGVFEVWSGSSWVTGLGSDAVFTRRRFRSTGSLPGGIDLYAKLSI